ncbi:MAG TPA: inositol monophosphatase family protein [Vicinamibacterales bacterium]|nr:inositol monophosphatase family protein [Vicinamibacterales bacterium]
MPLDPAYLSTAIRGALAAGRIHARYFRSNLDVKKKGPIDLVTAADLEVEREFRALIAREWPDHSVLGEEQADGATPARRCRWIIDPVDGTTNFAHGLAFFCVSIALEVAGRIELGVVYDATAGELFVAERGAGARLNGRPIHVSQRAELIDALLCTGFPYSIREHQGSQVDIFAAFLGRARAVRRLGSAALDLCYVAAGRFEAFWEQHLHPWDMAAGALIVQEAGGRVTGYDAGQVDLFRGQIVASNGRLHDDLLQVIGAHYR